MRITIVEDDVVQLDEVKRILNEAFEDVVFTSFLTGSEYLQSLASLSTNPPDIFLFDVMLPWRPPGSIIPPPPGGWNVDRGGLTLIGTTRKYAALANIPAIIWTVVHPEQLANALPARTVFISKNTPSNHLVTVVRSLLVCLGNKPSMRDSKWRSLVAASEIKPSIYGISLDLKKVWSIIRKHND